MTLQGAAAVRQRLELFAASRRLARLINGQTFLGNAS